MTVVISKRWPLTTLSVVAELKGGLAKGKKRSKGEILRSIPFLRVANVQAGFLDLNAVHSIEASENEIEKLVLKHGDVLFNEGGDRDKLGRGWVWEGQIPECIHQNHVFRARPQTGVIDPYFLSYWGNSAAAKKYFEEEGKQTVNLASISLSKLGELPVPLPSLAEQRRIVAKLEALLAKVDASRKRLERIPIILRRFRQAVLASACDGRLTEDWRERNPNSESAGILLQQMQIERKTRWEARHEKRRYSRPEELEETNLPTIPESWVWSNFDQCSWEITVGHVGPMRDRYIPKGKSFLRSQNIRPLRFDSAGLVFIPEDFHQTLSKSALYGGEILVVRSGANTGDCCVFPSEFGEANCSDLVIARPLSGLLAEYGASYVASPQGQAHLAMNETGIAQPHFNIGAMRVKPFPLPPKAEQQEIVKRINDLFTFADQIEARYAKAKTQVDRLTESVLGKAFRGELVAKEPTDEPADVFLNRLAAAAT